VNVRPRPHDTPLDLSWTGSDPPGCLARFDHRAHDAVVVAFWPLVGEAGPLEHGAVERGHGCTLTAITPVDEEAGDPVAEGSSRWNQVHQQSPNKESLNAGDH